MTFVPGEVEMLIHYYACVEEHWSQLNGSDAGSEWIRRALRDGLLTKAEGRVINIERPSSYEATPKLARLVQAWCETPMPEQKWVMPE